MMTKNLRKIAAFLMSLGLLCAILMTCSGCGGNKDKEALLGDWVATVDMTEMMNDELKAGLGDDELMSYFDLGTFSIKVNLSFKDDGTYTFSADEAALEQSLDNVIEVFRNGIIAYFEDTIAAQGADITVDELLESSGYTLDGFLEEAFDKEDMMSSMDEMESSGTFQAKSGVLSLTDDEGTGLEAYTLENDTLTLTGEGVEDGSLMGLYPLVFTRK